MSITAYNNTKVMKLLKIKDYYVLDSERKLGYYGALEFPIAAGGTKSIPYCIFTDEMMVEKKPQEVHVKSGEETLLILGHEVFRNNKGNDLFFEIGDGGVLRGRFAPPTGGKSTAQRIWACFVFAVLVLI